MQDYFYAPLCFGAACHDLIRKVGWRGLHASSLLGLYVASNSALLRSFHLPHSRPLPFYKSSSSLTQPLNSSKHITSLLLKRPSLLTIPPLPLPQLAIPIPRTVHLLALRNFLIVSRFPNKKELLCCRRSIHPQFRDCSLFL